MSQPTCWELLNRLPAPPPEWARRILLYGPPGAGKTHWALAFASRSGARPYVVACVPDAPSDAWIGFWCPSGQDWRFRPGLVYDALRAAAHGERVALIINDIHLASPEAMAVLMTATDDVGSGQAMAPDGTVYRPSSALAVVATSNRSPDTLPGPIRSRLPVRIHVDRPAPDGLARLDGRLRRLVESGSLSGLTLREWLVLDAAIRDLGAETAARLLGLAADTARALGEAYEVTR